MKKTLLLLFLLVAGAAHAQIVNIPDANFKSYLLDYEFGETPLDANGDGEIQVSEAEVPTYIYIYEFTSSPIMSLQGIEAFTNLTYLNIGCSAPEVDFSALTQLVNLNLVLCGSENIDLDGLVNLQYLSFQMIAISSLDLTGLPSLRNLNLLGLNDLTSINIGYNPSIKVVTVSSASLVDLDLSGCPNLNNLDIQLDYFAHDAIINLKNGSSSYANGFNISPFESNYIGSGHCFVCLDEGEEEMFGVYPNPVYVLTNYCTFTPGGNYNTITGTVTFDADDNGCSASDIYFPHEIAISDGTENGISVNSTGNYNFYTQAGTFTVAPQFENDWFSVTPATVTFADSDNNITTQNFCVTANGVHPDLEVLLLRWWARPGFDTPYHLIYTNKGNQTLSGDVTFTYNDAVLDYVSASPVESASAMGSLTWNYTNLLPFESREVVIILNVNSPMEAPPVNINDVLSFLVMISPTDGDETPEDNVFEMDQIVVGSYDPNDITCLEGETVHPDHIGEYLHYNINFENTGSYPASFVVVKDIIDDTKFDISTLQLINASHDVEARVTGNKVEFYFDDINLTANGGKGNVVFKIKSLGTLQVNDDVTQQAEIFFDYNWPIVTNEATTVFSVLSNPGFEKDATIKVFPNPAGNTVTISAESELRRVELYDVQGRVLQSSKVSGLNFSLDVSARVKGVYFIKVVTEKGTGVEKVMKL